MRKTSTTLLLLGCILFSLCSSSLAQTCKSQTFTSNQNFTSCQDLSVLSSYLHWTYDQSTNTVQIAFRHTGATASTWIAWAINPSSLQMAGSQALVAYQNTSGVMHAYTSSITSTATRLPESTLSFSVSNLLATFENSEMTIYATLGLGSLPTTVNQVWQFGPVTGDTLSSHTTSGANMQSLGTLNLLDGSVTSTGSSAVNSRLRKRNIHGVLNAVSWGTLMPLGAIIARYLQVFHSADPAWFYMHIACQSSAYIVGVAGFATGIKLGSDSAGIQYDAHRNIGIILFCIGTLQVFALLLRPKKDHKYRLYWKIYHQAVGYLVIILSIVNIFKGFDILDPEKKWKKIYIGILIFLGVNASLLEAFTWFIVIKRKRSSSSDKHSAYAMNGLNGANGANGYGARTQHGV